MTGRRLYDRYCDATKKYVHQYRTPDHPPVAWAYLSYDQQRRWSGMAAAIAGKARYS